LTRKAFSKDADTVGMGQFGKARPVTLEGDCFWDTPRSDQNQSQASLKSATSQKRT
jgi:hypothetical protein